MIRAILFPLTLLAALSLGEFSTAAPVRIAYSSISGAMLPLWVAKDKKLVDKHGDREILNEVYRIYGERHLPKTINVDLEGVKGLLKGLGSAAAANFADATLMQELEREAETSQQKTRNRPFTPRQNKPVSASSRLRAGLTRALFRAAREQTQRHGILHRRNTSDIGPHGL